MPPLRRQWRSLEEAARDPSFVARAAQEFPGLAEALAAPRDRRRVLKLMAAAFAMTGLGGCDDGAPGGTLIPAVRVPPNIVPGLPNFYSTANVVSGYAAGVVVEHQMGRPIKVEGNPLHPASLGATDVFAQAQLLDFYDPDRAAGIMRRGEPADRQDLLTALAARRAQIAESQGAGFRILTGTVTSPTLAARLDALLSRYPQARWHQWEPVSRDNVLQGAVAAYGRPVDIVAKLDAADVVLAIDSDLLSSAPGHVRYAREFASRRNPTRTRKMSRLYAVEPTPSLTGAAADHRFVAGPRELHGIFLALAAGILQRPASSTAPGWVDKVVADLTANQGRALVHAGPGQPAETHALVHAINEKLGARGTTLELVEPAAHAPVDQAASLRDLVEDMRAGKVSTLLIIDSNPVYAAPGALGFAAALKRVAFSVALMPAPNETGDATVWAVPMTHPWEDWGDARAYDGTATILQPQALPLYDGASAARMLALFGDPAPPDTLAIVRATWNTRLGGDFAKAWHDALADGVVSDTASAAATLPLRADAARQTPPAPPDLPLTILFRPDPHLWDGRYANNAWLQELPRPLTKLTWDNPLLVSPELARQANLRNGDKVSLSIGDASLTVPAWIVPGQAADCAVALLGFGRRQAGSVGTGAGFDFYPLAGRADAPSLQKIAGHVELASTDHHNLIFNASGDLVRHGTLAEYVNDPHFLAAGKTEPRLYRWKPEGPAAWAMSVDLNACIGCNACVVACQAENNIPVVGKEQVIHQREMHWLRIDRYYEGGPDAPDSYFQPMLCMHCEEAPCEVVCPVGATVHDAEGLNVMVYNRCVGTRFCSNNCPYKVRRFNYFAYAQEEHRPAEARNPDVTVRGRGVMEKCTFCLQRIAEARIAADRENRPVGEVKTACQAACPTQAFTFGNLAASTSEVAKRKQSPLDYAVLEDQNTHPRVTYEARIRNPNPAIEGGGA
ncbi:MAG TPA: TAT-variant-translocated molybdopterin oxidoreductase [Stellaceae bacterium]|nr:TAT-variant-translocated molybdopterin oxidoreductase [Stellaceae bacterium]